MTRCVGIESEGCAERCARAPGEKVLIKDRRAPRERGRMRTIIVNRRTRLEALVMRCVRDDRRGLARHDVARVDAGVVVHPDPSPSPDVIHETRGRRVAAREDDVAAAAAEDDGFHRSKLLRPSHGPQPSPIHPFSDRVAERFAAGDRGRDVDVELRVDVVDAAAESDLVLEVRRAFGARVDAPAKRFRSFEATNVGVELKGVIWSGVATE